MINKNKDINFKQTVSINNFGNKKYQITLIEQDSDNSIHNFIIEKTMRYFLL